MPHVAKALAALKKRASLFRVLGSYPRAVTVRRRADVPCHAIGSTPAARSAASSPCRATSRSRIAALMLGGIAEGDTRHQRLPRRRGLPRDPARAARARRAHRATGSTQVRRARGRRSDGLHGAAAPLDMGNAGTAMRLFMGLLAPQRFDSTLIGDASLMRRPMERVAVPLRLMGAQITHRRTAARRCRSAARRELRAIDYELPVASAQVKSAMLLAALGADGPHAHHRACAHARSHRAHAGRLRRRAAARGAHDCARGRPGAARHAVAVPADFSSAAFFIVAGCLAASQPLLIAQRRRQSHAHRSARHAAADGRRHPRASARPPAMPGAEPVADIEVRASQLHGIDVPEALVPLAIDEFPVFFIAAACAQGETVVRGAHELRVKESDRLAAMAAGLEASGSSTSCCPMACGSAAAAGFAGGRIDSHGDHRIAMAFAVAALQGARADRDRRCRQRRHLVPGLRGHRRCGGLARAGTVTEPRSGHDADAPPGRHHRRSQRLGQGHHQPRRWPGAPAGICSTAGRSTAWWPSPGCAPGPPPMTPRRMPGSPGPCRWSSVRSRRGRAGAPGRGGRHRGDPLGAAGQGASRVAAWPEVRTALLERQRPSPGPPAWWPTAATWAPWSSPRPPSRSS